MVASVLVRCLGDPPQVPTDQWAGHGRGDKRDKHEDGESFSGDEPEAQPSRATTSWTVPRALSAEDTAIAASCPSPASRPPPYAPAVLLSTARTTAAAARRASRGSRSAVRSAARPFTARNKWCQDAEHHGPQRPQPDHRDDPSLAPQRTRGLAAGATDYLVKPVGRDELLGALRRMHVLPILSMGQSA